MLRRPLRLADWRTGYIAELWQGYLTLPDACCVECFKGNTWDCDVNPLKLNLTRGDFAIRLLIEGECP